MSKLDRVIFGSHWLGLNFELEELQKSLMAFESARMTEQRARGASTGLSRRDSETGDWRALCGNHWLRGTYAVTAMQ